MNLRVLITGSSGFLGRYLIRYAPTKNIQIIAQYRNDAPPSAGRPIQFVQLDFLKENWSELEACKPDIIIHTAAAASIDECEVNPVATHKVNYEATARLAEIAKKNRARFIFISTDVVYDGSRSFYSEKDLPNPQNSYARSKFEAEKYLLDNLSNVVVGRPSVFYGRGLNGRPSFTETMLSNLYNGRQVYVFSDQFRTPILINNLASALWELAEIDFTGIINLGGPKRITRQQMGETLCDLFRLDSSLLIPITTKEAKLVAARPLDCSLDTTLARSVLKTGMVDCRIGFSIAYR